jgi:chemotaxis protein CheD
MSTASTVTVGRTDIGVVKCKAGQFVNLMAGQVYFGNEASCVKTLLGSCVAITLWHPQRRWGGMCHFLLPQRARKPAMPRDARFGDETIHMLVEMLTSKGTQPSEYEAHLYGGADTMPDQAGVKFNVGERNIECGWTLIDRFGFALKGVDVGDTVPRTVELNMTSGAVSMRRGEPMKRPA